MKYRDSKIFEQKRTKKDRQTNTRKQERRKLGQKVKN